MMKEQALLC